MGKPTVPATWALAARQRAARTRVVPAAGAHRAAAHRVGAMVSARAVRPFVVMRLRSARRTKDKLRARSAQGSRRVTNCPSAAPRSGASRVTDRGAPRVPAVAAHTTAMVSPARPRKRALRIARSAARCFCPTGELVRTESIWKTTNARRISLTNARSSTVPVKIKRSRVAARSHPMAPEFAPPATRTARYPQPGQTLQHSSSVNNWRRSGSCAGTKRASQALSELGCAVSQSRSLVQSCLTWVMPPRAAARPEVKRGLRYVINNLASASRHC